MVARFLYKAASYVLPVGTTVGSLSRGYNSTVGRPSDGREERYHGNEPKRDATGRRGWMDDGSFRRLLIAINVLAFL
jgi:hypothetical protein